MTNSKRVLVTAAGSGPGVAIIKAIRRATIRQDFVLAVDIVPAAAGLYLADQFALVPKAKDPIYVDRLLELCKQHSIGMIIPILDVEVAALVAQRSRFESNGIVLAANPLPCVLNANDKNLAYLRCSKAGIQQPRKFNSPLQAPRDAFPMLGKPTQGVGSLGIVRLESPEHAVAIGASEMTGLIWQEFITGDEFSVDTFGRPSANWFFAVPRHRRLIKAGQMVQGTTVNDRAIIDFAGNICDAFDAADVCCVQIIRRPDRRLYFVELNPRFGTGVSLSIAAGVDFPQIEWLHYTDPDRIEAKMGHFQDGLEMLRYWEEVYR